MLPEIGTKAQGAPADTGLIDKGTRGFAMRALILILSVLLTAGVPASRATTYSNFINDNGWTVETSPLECRLTNTIPFYGDAVFRKRAGEQSAEFFLNARSGHFATGEAVVTAEAPVWKPGKGAVVLGQIPVEQGIEPIKLGERYTELMLSELHQGREIVITRDAWYSDREDNEARLAITSIAFRRAYSTYLDCLGGLLPINFDQIKRTAIYFGSGEHEELPEDELLKLKHILLYAQADPRLRELYIDGHTDSVGTRDENLKLSEARAKLVTNYLVKHGLPEERIITRWHGERYPVESNAKSATRAQNRRVTIRLERSEPVNIPPLAASGAPAQSQQEN